MNKMIFLSLFIVFSGVQDIFAQEEAQEILEEEIPGAFVVEAENISIGELPFIESPLFLQQESPEVSKDQGRLVILGLHGTLQLYHFRQGYEEGTDGSAGVSRRSRLNAGVTIGNVSADLGLDISHLLEDYSFNVNKDFDMEAFVSKATITVQNINDHLTAVIVGKQIIPFGQRIANLPLPSSWDNPVEDIRLIRGVIGITAKLSDLPILEGLVDELELSVFESSTLDFSMEGGLGVAIRLTKTIESDELEHELSFSYAQKENNHVLWREGTERRASLGIISETPFTDDTFVWAEGIHFENHPIYRAPKEWALSTGVVSKISSNTYLSGELTWANNFTKSYATGFWFNLHQKVGSQLLLGAEYRHTKYKDTFYGTFKEDVDQLSLTLRILFYKTKARRIKTVKDLFLSAQ